MSDNRETVIKASGLTKFYGDLEVVKGIDFEVKKGECFGFLGPNGAGKTTTIRMIQCFTPITRGELFVLGMQPGADSRKIKGSIGVVPQEDLLDTDLKVLENLTVYANYYGIPRKTAYERAWESLKFLQLEEKAYQRVEHLSGGMKRRLLIARALINQPELLILDEPTTGLDPQARHLIWAKIRELQSKGVTMALTTHYMDEAEQLCDHLVIMNLGEIIARGKPRDLIKEYVGDEVMEIRSSDLDPATILGKLDGCRYEFEQTTDTVYLFLTRGCGVAEKVVEMGITHYVHRMATLEDVFLKLTGRELRE